MRANGLLLVLAITACSSGGGATDAGGTDAGSGTDAGGRDGGGGTDGAATDAGATDAGSTPDSGTPIDAGGTDAGTTTGWWRPAPGTSWQWQLSGTLDLTVDAAMYDVDMENTSAADIATLHAAGRIVVCYVDVGSWENYRGDAAAFPAAVLGDTLSGWPDERWLDIRSTLVHAPLDARFDAARAKGCDGIEPDNVDGYTNTSGFPLTADDQLAFNRWVAAEVHARGMSVGLKNDLDQVPDLIADFDWALDEQCQEYTECDLLTPFVTAGKAVFEAEYNVMPATFCADSNARNFDAIYKHLALDAYRVACR